MQFFERSRSLLSVNLAYCNLNNEIMENIINKNFSTSIDKLKLKGNPSISAKMWGLIVAKFIASSKSCTDTLDLSHNNLATVSC